MNLLVKSSNLKPSSINVLLIYVYVAYEPQVDKPAPAQPQGDHPRPCVNIQEGEVPSSFPDISYTQQHQPQTTFSKFGCHLTEVCSHLVGTHFYSYMEQQLTVDVFR